MSYTKQTWETGDTITAEKLNHIEDGIDDASRQISDVEENQIPELKNAISQLGDVAAFKAAILQLAQKVAYIDGNGQDYYDDLYDALYPPAPLASISAVYTQSGTVYTTDTLDSLKPDLVVTANYTDGTTAHVTDYTLSGTLTEGTSIITVSYDGKTDTFSVIVTSAKSDMNGWTSGVAYTDLDIIQNEYSKMNNGELLPYTGWDRTGYVPCHGASTLVFPPMPQEGTSTVASNNFYDENHVRVSNIMLSRTDSTTINVPSTAYYYICSSNRDALASCINAGIVPYA